MEDEKPKKLHSRVIDFAKPDYSQDYSFRPWDGENPLGVHTTAEMVACLHKYKNVELSARVLGLKENHWRTQDVNREVFLEGFRKDPWKDVKFRETDFFATDTQNAISNTVGQDFTPLLGGPFYKNLYFYQDYIRMHADAFFAYNNDPFARAIVQITRDFVLGTGFQIRCDLKNDVGKLAMAAWKAFEETNDFQEQVDQFVVETSVYGESMFWELPGNQTKITYQLGLNEKAPTGIIPRVRIIDPSNIVEIVTYPEDILRPLFYVWLAPTQYQIYGSGTGFPGADKTNQPSQPTTKFIYRQIPANQIIHCKINSVSNEKRGRSDFFPVFPYLKRLRDSVDYALIALQKVSAWAIDTTIDGDQADIDAYVENQASLGTIPAAGSEHVHSKAITRQYLGNQKAGSGVSNAFEWALSNIAAGTGIPVSYFGTHLSGGTTKASALVATEPVAKKMEKRREVVRRMLKKMWAMVMKRAGLPNIDCDIIFPEIITQDRTQKLKDLLLCSTARWFKPERAANMAAEEFHVSDYNYEEELEQMETQLKEIPQPLADPVLAGGGAGKFMPGAPSKPKISDEEPGTEGLSGTEKTEFKKNDSTL